MMFFIYLCVLINFFSTTMAEDTYETVNVIENTRTILQCPSYKIENDHGVIVRSDSALVAIKTSRLEESLSSEPNTDYLWNDKQSRFEIELNPVTMQHDRRKFTCKYANKKGLGDIKSTKTMELLVFNKPEIVQPALENERIGVVIGKAMNPLDCTAMAINGEILLRWFKQGSSLCLAEKTGYKNVTGTLALPTVDLSDLSVYRCEALVKVQTNSGPQVLQSERFVRLEKDYPPSISIKDKLIFTDYDVSEKIYIEADGQPQPDVHCVFTKGPGSLIRGETYSNQRLTVVLIDVQQHHFGTFNCTAQNIHGSISDSGRLRQGPDVPRIVSPLLSNNSDYIELAFKIKSSGFILNSTVNIYQLTNTSACSGKPQKVTIHNSQKSFKNYVTVNSNRLRTFETYLKDLKESTRYGVRVQVCSRTRCSDFSSCKIISTAKFNGTNCYSCKAPEAKGVVSPEGTGSRIQSLHIFSLLFCFYLSQILIL